MTIHDEIILKLIEPNSLLNATGYVVDIVGSTNITYKLEEIFWSRGHYEKISGTFVRMAPDIFVHDKSSGKTYAIELENDEHWDFGHSLRQVKKYRRNHDFDEVVVIIPKKHERFAPLYVKEGFRVYLWNAERVFECKICHKGRNPKHPSKCETMDCKGELELIGVKNVEFIPFTIE